MSERPIINVLILRSPESLCLAHFSAVPVVFFPSLSYPPPGLCSMFSPESTFPLSVLPYVSVLLQTERTHLNSCFILLVLFHTISSTPCPILKVRCNKSLPLDGRYNTYSSALSAKEIFFVYLSLLSVVFGRPPGPLVSSTFLLFILTRRPARIFKLLKKYCFFSFLALCELFEWGKKLGLVLPP